MIIKKEDIEKYQLLNEEDRTTNGIIDLIYSSVFSLIFIYPTYYYITENILILLILFTIFRVLYYVISEFYFHRTLGKLHTSSIVTNYDNKEPSIKQIFIRNIVRIFTGFASVFEDYPYAFHDKISKTRVIRKKDIKVVKFRKINTFQFISLLLGLACLTKGFGIETVLPTLIILSLLSLFIDLLKSK